jgi:superoxide reductase
MQGGKTMQFFVCEECGNLVGALHFSGAPMTCCGQKMKDLTPNTSDGAKEKHVPQVTVEGDLVTVEVGSVPHPMKDEHYIAWVYLQTEKGGQRKNLRPGGEPKAVFVLHDDKAVAAYEYCNLHGLWKKEL